MKPIISVEGLWKQYRIGQKPASYGTLRDSLSGAARTLMRRNTPDEDSFFWALRDVNFQVKPGEVLGIIGRNGAGKSTLLKVLSRITEPTQGKIELYGRIASLLEVGTGFHPELSGRENIFLNGAILGMSRVEIARKFDEIVDFAEVEKFIDTPVKHYSSGMYLRLAFAVAAHLEPEILVVDEVLAVGDTAFTKKCMGKMGRVASEGRTVLFVSHALPSVQGLCHTGLWLRGGQVMFYGPVGEAISKYVADASLSTGVCDFSEVANRGGSGEFRLQKFWLENADGQVVDSVSTGDACSLAFEYSSLAGRDARELFLGVSLHTLTGMPVSVFNTNLMNADFALAPSQGCIRFRIPRLALTAGRYVMDVTLATQSGFAPADIVQGVAAFDVTEGDFYGTGKIGSTSAPMLIEGAWQLQERVLDTNGVAVNTTNGVVLPAAAGGAL
jgi:lipopolysaccharide transport system ATP-binding protein